MILPPLLSYETVAEYKRHYERMFMRGKITTADGIRVYFKPQKFGHAFYENSQNQKGPKDQFSFERAERMNWVSYTLENATPDQLYVGWNKDKKTYENSRRVSVVYEKFVVVIELSAPKPDFLKGNFITCYVADRSIQKILTAPKWDRASCIQTLSKN